MRWYYVFIKGLKEQIRDYWILILIVVMSPLFVFMYYLMLESEQPEYDIVFVNQDRGTFFFNQPVNLGDSLIYYIQLAAEEEAASFLNFSEEDLREIAIKMLQNKKSDVLIVLPENFTISLLNPERADSLPASLELVGDITDMDYMIGAVWTEELINQFVQEVSGIHLPVQWRETTLGFSGQRSEFELYVPGLMILAIIMIIFSASAAIVREPETHTLERLKISNLSSLEFLTGTSLVQVIIAVISLFFTILTAISLGYTMIPGTLWFILLIAFLTCLSMISFSLIVAAICRSIKDVAIIGTFPLFILMFFTGAAFPISGRGLFSIGNYTAHVNDILSPTWAVDALHKVLVRGQAFSETYIDMMAILILTLLYFVIGVWAFRRRHMRAH